MGSFSMAHWLVVAVMILVLFGRGKIAETMGDFGKGIKSFRNGISEDDITERKLPAAKTEANAAPAGSDTKTNGDVAR